VGSEMCIRDRYYTVYLKVIKGQLKGIKAKLKLEKRD